ncbi:hypothetical protein NX059_007686 [Plenodomus lindquistii]|nr:hypothetical protein NX059_007686 [Plenodomus lindquistii]
MSNFDQLCEVNAFNLPENWARIPKTIRDSMVLTEALGVQYLWIDRFCIKQDDPVNKSRHIAAMASIYANAYVTVAAVDGPDGDFGLPGLTERAMGAQPFPSYDFGSSCRMISEEHQERKVSKKVAYHGRGWTFQEWTLSHRILVFQDQSVDWLCLEERIQENGVKLLSYIGKEFGSVELVRSKSFWSDLPDIQNYLSLVTYYTSRDLSEPRDILAAFSAIITVKGRAMEGGILHGIPELFFHATLLWMPKQADIVRRTDSNGIVLNQFPSWSWAGWSGAIDTLLAQTTSKYHSYILGLADALPLFTPLVDFKKRYKNGTRSAERMYDVYTSPPTPEARQLSDDQLGFGRRLMYPVPYVENPEAVSPISDGLYSTIIEFKARRGFFSLAAISDGPLQYSPVIVNAFGDIIGTVAGSLGTLKDALPTERTEFIRISAMDIKENKEDATWLLSNIPHRKLLHRRCVSSYCDYDDLDCELDANEPWAFYNILWIEWKDDVAYRKGLGVIFQHAWDAAETDEIDVRLG